MIDGRFGRLIILGRAVRWRCREYFAFHRGHGGLLPCGMQCYAQNAPLHLFGPANVQTMPVVAAAAPYCFPAYCQFVHALLNRESAIQHQQRTTIGLICKEIFKPPFSIVHSNVFPVFCI